MIEHVLMDYEGEPVSIEEGEMFTWYPDEGEHWNSETCEFEPDEDEEEAYGDDDDAPVVAPYFDTGWHDCN